MIPTSNTLTTSTSSVTTEIDERASKVRTLLKASATVWLSIAQEVSEAKKLFNKTDFELFLNKCSLSRPIADKLLSIAKAKILYIEESKAFLEKLEGWTTLYEVAKLNEVDIRAMYNELQKIPDQCLTRSFIEQFRRNNHPSISKTLTVATIIISEDDIIRLDHNEFSKLRDDLYSISRIIDRCPLAAQITLHTKALEKAETLVLNSSAENSDAQEHCDFVEATAQTVENVSYSLFSTPTH
jgi:hypothetical protein